MALNPLVSLFGRLVARSGRKCGNRQTDGQIDGQTYRPSTVTLAAHARRGLIRLLKMKHINKRKKHVLRTEKHLNSLQHLQHDYVLVPADKAPNNVIKSTI